MGLLSFFQKVPSGEQSELREQETIITIQDDGFILDSSKLNYQLTRELYSNTHNKYKLGAHFAKPVINALTGFIGTPRIKSITDDESANYAIKQYIEENKSKIIETIRNTLREGDCYLYVYHELLDDVLYNNELKIGFDLLLPENVNIIKINNKIVKAVIKTNISEKDEEGHNIKYTTTEIWTNEKYILKHTKIDVPAWFEELTDIEINNPYGFIPVIHFKNESESFRKYGNSELESIEPLIRAYHETMYNYLRASKVNSSPLLILKLRDKKMFLKNNFTEEEISSKKLKILRKDMITLDDGEEAYFLEIQAKSYKDLLEYLFMCIVDTSEIPEFIFGTAVSSSKASVSEQMPAFIKKIQKKQIEFESNFKLLARMVFAIYNLYDIYSEYGKINDYKTYIEWEDVDKEDINEKAQAISTLITGLVTAIESKLISFESAIMYLSEIIPTMDEYPQEAKKILKQFNEMLGNENLTEELTAQIDELRTQLNQNNTNTDNTQTTNNVG